MPHQTDKPAPLKAAPKGPATRQKNKTAAQKDRAAARHCAPTEFEADYLHKLGERVRDARARRGMTRKMLSHDSGVSERYLAQLESGRGNVSIVLLRQIARAMNMTVVDLVREGPEVPVELSLFLDYLGRLAPEDVARAHELVKTHFGERPDRRRRIALIGLRGAGKTTVGRLVAEALDVPFIELAREIEATVGVRLDEVFSLYGQAAFRRYEKRTLEQVIERHRQAVIATGGGLVSETATFGLLLNSCFTVWLKADPEDHMARVITQGDSRPMAGNTEAMQDLRRILRNREALYGKADATVLTSNRNARKVADEIVAILAQTPTSDMEKNKQDSACFSQNMHYNS